MKKYFDFDVLVERSGKQYRARVDSPAGQATIFFNLPFPDLELENFLLKIGITRRRGRSGGSLDVSAIKTFGDTLFKAVFDDAVYGCFQRSLDEARRQEAGLRLRLHLTEVPELADVPWEYLYYNSGFDRFLCLAEETPIVRYLDLPENIRPLGVKPPIRVLVMISSPSDHYPLEVEQEWSQLNQALSGLKQRGIVTLDRLPQATLGALLKQLRLADYHIFHYIGHGEFDAQTHDGVLILEDDHNHGHAVSGRDLGTLLFNERTLRLVLLNACEGARVSRTDPFAGSAQSLVRQGIPAVIAMQFEVTDEAAITLTGEFYDALADGYPVDAALTQARLSIFAQGNKVEWGTPVLYMRAPDGRIFDFESAPQPDPPKNNDVEPTHIFLSYKRNITPDEPLALQLFERLAKHHRVFIDQNMVVGTSWAERIEAELKRGDFLIILLSAQSVNSEMVKAEVETAHRLALEQDGRPRILPVRLDYRDPFPYPLNVYLDPINWAHWRSEEDTPGLIAELMTAIAGGALPLDQKSKSAFLREAKPALRPEPQPAAQLEMPEGTMSSESEFYVEREGDRIALAAIERRGVTITIKAPRQMGKSSLLLRVMQRATNLGKRVVFLDFQQFDKAALRNAEVFFRQFCAWLTFRLKMADRVEEFWKLPLGNVQRCSSFMEDYLLKEVKSHLVLAMDEVESTFDTDFRTDFFSMLRNWHNNRQYDPVWKKHDLVLVTSTEPYQLIENLNLSPFNVGEVIELPDFTPAQIAFLNQRHGSPLSKEEEQRLLVLLGGQPYLVRRALYLLASQRFTATDLFAQVAKDRGPFADHLHYHMFRLQGREDLVMGMLQVIRKGECEDERVFFRLRGAGLVKREGRAVLPRCQLYAEYFQEHLHG